MKACALTDTGRVRTANQDYVYASVEPVGSLPNLFVVADGMGGHQAGDYASRYIVENLVSYLQYTENSQIVPLLREAILKVNTMLYHEAKEKPEFSGMGTTLVLAVVVGENMHIVNIGDSRIYMAEKKAVKQLTRDHTLVQNLLDRGQISQQEALNHPKKHYITRAIGVGDTLDIDYQMYELKKESIVLLCTDGLSNYLEIEKLPELLKNCIRKESLADLIDFANDQGGSDNITAVMLYRK